MNKLKEKAIKNHEEQLRKSNPKPKETNVGGKRAGVGQYSTSVAYRMMDAVEEKPIEFLWPGRIACGKVTLLAGDPGLGKSQITAALAGIITQGVYWPVDFGKCKPGAVIFLSAEDDAADTIRPRLRAVNADLSKIAILDAVMEKNETGQVIRRSFSLKNDLERLEKMVKEIGNVRLIVIDPITAYLGGVDSHKNSDVRAMLSPLGDFAEKNDLAILAVSHLNKSISKDALNRINGSMAFVAASRAAFIVIKDKNNPERRLLLPLKNNLAKDTGGLAFSIVDCTLDSGISTSKVEWEPEPVNMTADEALNAPVRRSENSQIEEAKRFIIDLLGNDALLSNEVTKEAELLGYSGATIKRAKSELGVESFRESPKGKWYWRLPEAEKTPHAQTPLQTNEHLGEPQINKGLEGGQNTPDAHVVENEHLEKKCTEKQLQSNVIV